MSSKRRFTVLLGMAVLLALLAATWWFRAGGSTELPSPDTSRMVAPVSQRLEAARRDLLQREDDAEAWGRYGSVLDAHHLYREAERCYRRARELAPSDFRWTYLLAVVLDFRGGDGSEIVALFGEAHRLQPEFPPAYVRAGDALLRLGRPEEACASYREALRLDPDFAMAHRALGHALLARGAPAEALRELEAARTQLPEDQVVHAALARAYRALGREDEARAAASRAATLQPVLGLPDPVRYQVDRQAMDPASLSRRAQDHIGQRDYAAAVPDLEVLRELFPDQAKHALRLGVCYGRTGKPEQAEQELRQAQALGADSFELFWQLGLLAEGRGEFAEAADAFRAAAERAPERTAPRVKLGEMLGRGGDLEGALQEFERAASLATPDARLHHNWGTVLQHLGQLQPAVAHFRAALALEPDNASSLFNLGTAMEQLGRPGEAVPLYRRAAQLDPQGPAGEQLRRLGQAGG